MRLIIIQTLILTYNIVSIKATAYEPTWESIDSRPLPQWYDEAKIGIFIHWGVYSVPSYGSEWFWDSWKSHAQKEIVKFMMDNYPPRFTYQEFANSFKAELFNPAEWADLFKSSGAKYVVLTSKHHEGFALWPSKYSFSWNSQDVGPHRDLVGDLARAIRNRTDLKFGLYHSLYEWFNPLYLADKKSNFTKNNFVVNKVLPEMVELVHNYHPEVIWSDGEWEAPYTYWKSTEFLAWLYNESPVKDTVVVNDRWGSGDVICKHGGFYTCNDRYNPGILQTHKWENAMTIDKVSWGYRRNAKIQDYLTTHELLVIMAQTISTGGNMLINVGPSSDGKIAPIFQERLLNLGIWLSINGEAIYGSSPWKYQNDTEESNVWYTAKGSDVYAIVLKWPESNLLQLEHISSLFLNNITVVRLLGHDKNLPWMRAADQITIRFPLKSLVTTEWAWVLKIEDKSLRVNENVVFIVSK